MNVSMETLVEKRPLLVSLPCDCETLNLDRGHCGSKSPRRSNQDYSNARVVVIFDYLFLEGRSNLSVEVVL